MLFTFQITHSTRPGRVSLFQIDVTPAMVAAESDWHDEVLTFAEVARMAAADEADAIVRGAPFQIVEVR